MKKLLIILIAVMMVIPLAACGEREPADVTTPEETTPQITPNVTTPQSTPPVDTPAAGTTQGTGGDDIATPPPSWDVTTPTQTPEATTPVITTPVATPAVTTPVVTTPVETPVVTTPVVTTPVATPAVTTPVVTTPVVTPAVTTPVVTTPVETPAVTTPVVTTPVVTPAVTTPVVTTPVETPAVTTPLVTTPVVTPAVTTPVVTTPVETPVVTTPVVTTPVETPAITTPVVTTPVETPVVTTPVITTPVETTTEAPETTEAPIETTVPVETTTEAPETTEAPIETTVPVETTTEAPETTEAPIETTVPVETTTETPETTEAPIETTVPVETTTEAPETTEAPIETTAPVETTTDAPETTEAPIETTAPVETTTEAPETTDAPIETTVPVETTTEAPETTEAPIETTTPTEDTTVPDTEMTMPEVVWHSGKAVQSSGKNRTPGFIDKENYMYTDVITIPKAGTKISFVDDILNGVDNKLYGSTAGGSVYIISSWKLEGGEWVIDTNGINFSGSEASGSPVAFPEGGETGSGGNRTSITYSYVTSKDNETIRLCFNAYGSTKAPEVTFTENAGVGTYKEFENFIEASKEETYTAALKGITMALFGDSYLAGNRLRGDYTWASMISYKYEMTLYNHSIGGSTVSDKVTTNTPLVQRWSNDCGDPDIIIIEGGRNDSNQNLGIPIGTNADTTTHTFKGALIFMLRNLRAKYPNAMIVGVTSYNSGDRATTPQFAAAFKELFEYYGYPVINAADPEVSGVDLSDTNNVAFRSKYMEYPTDYSHLNYEGHKMAMPYFEAALVECYTKYKAGNYTEKALPDAYGGTVVENVNWNSGYIHSGSSSGSTVGAVGGSAIYRYSDVITVPEAGTRLYFFDIGNTMIGNEIALVFSSWKKDGDNWVIDTSGANLDGTTANYTQGNGVVVWSYVTTKPNENIRITYKCDNETATPEVRAGAVGEENTIKWNNGFIGSSSYANESERYKIVGSSVYTYTDVFTVPSAGTAVSFTVTKGTPANSNIFAFSSWKDENGTWVIDKTGANFAGSGSSRSLISQPSGENIVYTYITSVDGENLRICYRCGESAERPEITFTEGAGKGTFAQYNEWLAQEKELYYSDYLKDLNVAFFGDSYLAGQAIGYNETWIGILGEKYGMTLKNVAQGGAAISNYGYPQANDTPNPLVNRLATDLGSPDIIVISGGRNDSTRNVPLGDGTKNTDTFLGAIRYMYEELSEKYPNATIVFVTAWGVGDVNFRNDLGLTTHDYATEMVNFCAAQGYYCIDAATASKSGVDINDTIFRKLYSQADGDYSHLNYFGQRLVYSYFDRQLDAIMAKENGKEATKTNVVPVTWANKLVLCASYGTRYERELNNALTMYKSTELFTVPKKGTTIYFRDCITPEGKTGDNVYIVLNYKYDVQSDTWVADEEYTEGNLVGNTMNYIVDGDYVIWTYTTQKDNEVLRLCIRCANDPDYTVVRFIEPEDDATPVEWNSGFINSGAIGSVGTVGGSGVYRYSSVITVEKAGSTVYFKDFINGDGINDNYYLFSSWKLDENGKWVFDASATNLKASDAKIQKVEETSEYIIWAYTTEADNENIRVCQRCASDPSYTVVYVEEPKE